MLSKTHRYTVAFFLVLASVCLLLFATQWLTGFWSGLLFVLAGIFILISLILLTWYRLLGQIK